VSIRDVVTTRSAHLRDNRDVERGSFGTSGPMFLFACENIDIQDCGIIFPSFREGWWLIDCRKVRVNRFQFEGPKTFHPALTSTPLNIFGPRTADVVVTGSRISNCRGSVANFGGAGPFVVRDCVFQGVIGPRSMAASDPGRIPAEGAYGKGLDFGSEHQEDTYRDHPSLVNVLVERCQFLDLFSYSLRFIKRASTPVRRVQIRDCLIRNGFRGIEAVNASDLTVQKNRIESILRYVAEGGAFGRSMLLSNSDNVSIVDNVFDGLSTKPFMYENSDSRPREAEGGIALIDVRNVSLLRNSFAGFRHSSVSMRRQPTSSEWGPVKIEDNTFRRAGGARGLKGAITADRDFGSTWDSVQVGRNRFGDLSGQLEPRSGAPRT
jgi:hypothetical protein